MSEQERKRPMTKRQAYQTANLIVANLLANYFEVGQPFEDLGDTVSGQRVHDELRKLQDRAYRYGASDARTHD